MERDFLKLEKPTY